jgi:hypothetical protein
MASSSKCAHFPGLSFDCSGTRKTLRKRFVNLLATTRTGSTSSRNVRWIERFDKQPIHFGRCLMGLVSISATLSSRAGVQPKQLRKPDLARSSDGTPERRRRIRIAEVWTVRRCRKPSRPLLGLKSQVMGRLLARTIPGWRDHLICWLHPGNL